MLVYYNNHEEALTVLSNYAYNDRFPPNPNAYVYLYKFLKEYNPSKRKILKVMKVYLFIKKKKRHFFMYFKQDTPTIQRLEIED